MPFIALPPDPASPDGEVVAGDGWYPDIDVNAMRDALRIGELVTDARLIEAIKGGQLTIEGELEDWRAAREVEGAADLSAVDPARMTGGTHRLTLLYTRAVRFAAAAELSELHRDLTATETGQARADTAATTAPDYHRLATSAVRDILGTGRVAVELI
ncbi:head completion/stabilization protein [Novosphingobium beihaiensis]|uniref:Head completion/stabilization protein n=1 Tax=Novosphingobium beihaiensis TaxID=2930389 RepID=A0ABT0BW37_9SPHN|nr:head completion/stabilization protein [Novosphingobium beihaiensis]MCJ2189158.1 head completion/stabilization protein [Novosphingobium beihaiensis]